MKLDLEAAFSTVHSVDFAATSTAHPTCSNALVEDLFADAE